MVLRFLFMFFIIITSGKSYSFSFGILRGNSIDHQPLNDTNVLYLPARLKPSLKSHILPGTGGGSGDEDDDSRRKKPPFFLTPDLPFMAKGESGFGQILDEIARRLELPLSEEEKQEQEAYLDQLEADLREYRQQQQQAELLGHLASDFSFSHYPGYQDSGGSGKTSYTVPGIMSLPTTRSKTARKVTGGAGASSDGSQFSAIDEKKSPRRADKKRRSGPPDRDPPRQYNKRKTTEATKEYLRKTVTSEKRSCTFRIEINDETDLYRCPVCHLLVTYKNTIKTCSICEHAYCDTCYSKLVKKGKPPCPYCRQVNWSDRPLVRINLLKWECEECEREGIRIPDMKAHIPKCGQVFHCSNEGCDFSGSESDLHAHNGVCEYRPVKVGCYDFPHCHKVFIEERAIEVPQGQDINSWPDGVAIRLLLDAIEAQPQSSIEMCHACRQWIKTSARDNHEAACEKVNVQCDFCLATVQKGLVEKHKKEECDVASEQCECGEDVVLKHKSIHLREFCKTRLVYCEYKNCFQGFRPDQSAAHHAICPHKPIKCPNCFIYADSSLLKELHPCKNTKTVDGMELSRQALETPVPVYQTADGEFVYMELPVSYIGHFLSFYFNISNTSLLLKARFSCGVLELLIQSRGQSHLLGKALTGVTIAFHNDCGQRISAAVDTRAAGETRGGGYLLLTKPIIFMSELKTKMIILKIKRNPHYWSGQEYGMYFGANMR